MLFPGDQVILQETEDKLQWAVFLHIFHIRISLPKTKGLVFSGCYPVQTTVVYDISTDKIIW